MSLGKSEIKITRHIFTSSESKQLLKANGLDRFERLWELEAPWFENPNERREGISGVVTWQLEQEDGSGQRVFIKRQENHNTPSYRHPLKGEPTFYREFKNIQRLTAIGVPTIEVLYYGEAVSAGNRQAILVSKGLDDYMPLEQCLADSRLRGDPGQVAALLRDLVKAIKPMHQNGIRHGCLYGNHLFVKPIGLNGDKPAFCVKMLDLEKAHAVWFKNRAIEKDLSQLIRHTPGLDKEKSEMLLSYYFEESELETWRTRLARAIEDKKQRQKQKAGATA